MGKKSASALTHFHNPLLHFFMQCFLQICSLALAANLWFHQLPSSWQFTMSGIPISFPGKTVTLLLLHIVLVVFSVDGKKSYNIDFPGDSIPCPTGVVSKSLFWTLPVLWELLQGCSPRQWDSSTAQWRVFTQVKISDIVAAQFRECSFNRSWLVQITTPLPWISFLDFLSETVTKGTLACILPIYDKHSWLYLPWLFSQKSW